MTMPITDVLQVKHLLEICEDDAITEALKLLDRKDSVCVP